MEYNYKFVFCRVESLIFSKNVMFIFLKVKMNVVVRVWLCGIWFCYKCD